MYREMTRDHTNVALLVPGRYRSLVAYRPDNVTIDLGVTLFRTLRAIQDTTDEWAIELGGQSFSLGFEVHLAKMELDQWAYA